jgi:hypothetical protein
LERQAVVCSRTDLIKKVVQVLERFPLGAAVRGHNPVEHQLFEVFDALGFPHLVGEADQQVFDLVGGLGPGSVRRANRASRSGTP